MSRIKEGLAAIASEVLEDVRKEAKAIILDAEAEAKETLRIAKEEADKTYTNTLNEAKSKSETEKRRIQSLTEVEMRNRLLQTREDLVHVAFAKASEKLKDFAGTPEYHTLLLRLIDESAREIGAKTIVVHVNAADKDWLSQEILNRLGKQMKINFELAEETLDCVGGCRLQTKDEKTVYDNTLENRLQQLKPSLRLDMAKILFSEEAK
jgi:V/A-type H+/Na+-transporting ATPase subunit E